MGIVANIRNLAAMLAPHDVASPWASTDTLRPVELVGEVPALDIATREQALTVPALLRARTLITSTCARMHLIATRDGEDLDEQPRFLTRTDGTVSPFHRMLWTIDDLLFYGWSLWTVTRDADGRVTSAARVDWHRWSFSPTGNVTIDGAAVAEDRAILIPGVHDGVLAHGATTIREALALSRGVIRAVEVPTPVVELHQTNDRPMKQEDIKALKDGYMRARRAPGGGVMFTTSAIEVKRHGADSSSLLTEGRNTVAVELARLCSIPAPMIDATLSGTSLSYSNTASRMAELIAFGIAPLISAVTARLGMDDVVPRGTSIRIDTTEAVETLRTLTVPDDTYPAHDTEDETK